MNKNNQNNFTYLDQLIHSGDKEIQLEQDITLEKGEEVKFSEGIVIDTDDIIIDANRHSIDARNKTRIFKITEKNVIIKNIRLQNGYSKDSGGAVANVGSIKIIDSVLTNNLAEVDGGAVYNDISGKMNLMYSKFKNNTSELDGGAIFN